MTNKKVLLFLSIIISLFIITFAIIKLKVHSDSNNIPTFYSHATYAYDLSSPEKAVGAVDYVFVGKVNSIKRTEYRDPVEIETVADGSKVKVVSEPYTVYNMSVIKNIKGNLKEDVEIVQKGGIAKDEDSYILFEETSLLEKGKYYIILAYAVSENGELQINSKYTYVKIDIDSEEEINDEEIVKKYIDAYKKQEVPSDKRDNFKSAFDITM